MSKKRLGKGLHALIPEMPAMAGEGERSVQEVAVTSIVPNPAQPRQHYDQEALAELAASIREHGVVQPVLLRPRQDGKYEIVAGERRWRAAQMAGKTKIPAIIKSLSDREAAEVSLIENLQREDLNPVEEAIAYRRLMDEFNLSQEEVARRVGKSRAAVANTLRLLNLEPEILAWVEEGKITAGHARTLLSLPAGKVRRQMAFAVVEKGWSVRQLEDRVKKVLAEKKGNGKNKRKGDLGQDPLLADAVERLEDLFSTRVSIKRGSRGGKLEIHFYSEEDLQRIFEILLPEEQL